MTLDIDDYKVESWKVSRSMEDKFWVLKARIDEHTTPAFFQLLKATAKDHQNIRRTAFVGMIPAIDYQIRTAEDKADMTGYDYSWYLTVQYVPDSMLTIDIEQNPSRTIKALLGGDNWEKTTGIEPYRINDVPDWENIKTEFTFLEKSLRWSAITEVADYCDFVFIVKWREVAGTWRPCAYFVHEDDVDSSTAGIDIPAAVTITAPDKYLINDVIVKDEPVFRYNKILCIGFNQEDDEYFYSTAQTFAVANGDEIAREYTYTDPKLDTKDKTENKAQELLDFFQDSSITYIAKLKNRMDLELYQKIRFIGYRQIPAAEMRITKITYTREHANDVAEIEFSKNQALSQMKRLARILRTRIHYETFIDDMWEINGGYAQLIEDRPINMQGWSIYNTEGLHGPRNSDVTFRGWRHTDERWVEFLRWDHAVTGKALTEYIRVLEDIVIDNDIEGFPKLHFGIEPGKETYIRGMKSAELYGLDLTAGGAARGAMLSLINPVNEEADPYILLKRKTYLTTDMIIAGKITAWQSGETFRDLTFYDLNAGTKTLSDLAEAGLWVESRIEGEDFAQLKLDRAVNMQQNRIRNLEHPVYDRDAATKWWVEQQAAGSGDVSNPMTTHLYMNNYDIKDCDDIDCDDIDCDRISCEGIALEGYSSRINFNTGYISNLQSITMEGYSSYIKDIAYIDFWARSSSNPPSNPSGGTLWYDGNNAVFKYWTGSRWKTISAT